VAGGGAQRDGGLGNQRRWPARCFDDFLWRTVAQRPAWHGAEVHESGVGWLVLRRLEQRSAAMREQRSTARAEWSGWRSTAVAGRGEMASPTDRQRGEVTHGVVAASVTRGADVAAGR
jgi:hypothetical protein